MTPHQDQTTAVAARRADVTRLADAGRSLRQIADELGISKDTVRRDLADARQPSHPVRHPAPGVAPTVAPDETPVAPTGETPSAPVAPAGHSPAPDSAPVRSWVDEAEIRAGADPAIVDLAHAAHRVAHRVEHTEHGLDPDRQAPYLDITLRAVSRMLQALGPGTGRDAWVVRRTLDRVAQQLQQLADPPPAPPAAAAAADGNGAGAGTP